MDPRAVELVQIRCGLPDTEVRALLSGRREWRSAFVPDSARSVEARAKDDEEAPDAAPGELRLSGYSAVFDSYSEVLFGFLREQIKRGAFKSVLKRADLDVRLLVNHDGAPHARTTNGTLKLTEKPRGLFRDALLDDRRQDSRDMYYGVERGDFSQSSFAFTVKRDTWRYCDHVDEDGYAGCDCVWERDILEIGELLDDSVVTYPAYPATSATVARESEPSTERNALASDEEQRDTAGDTDTSQTPSVSDPNKHAMRTRIARLKGSHNVAGNHGGAR